MYRVRWFVHAGRPDSHKLSHWLLCERFVSRLLHETYPSQPIRIVVTDPAGVPCYNFERK